MTANVFKEDVDKYLAAGMDDHLGKPLDMGKVLKKLRFYLKKCRDIAANPDANPDYR
jgi:CheY-like chemotaxis protein